LAKLALGIVSSLLALCLLSEFSHLCIAGRSAGLFVLDPGPLCAVAFLFFDGKCASPRSCVFFLVGFYCFPKVASILFDQLPWLFSMLAACYRCVIQFAYVKDRASEE
jgi:hypothetical protein